jgi:hypothetical protein
MCGIGGKEVHGSAPHDGWSSRQNRPELEGADALIYEHSETIPDMAPAGLGFTYEPRASPVRSANVTHDHSRADGLHLDRNLNSSCRIQTD